MTEDEFNEALRCLGLHKCESEANDRMPIDFTVRDGEDVIACAYGTPRVPKCGGYLTDVTIECFHPENAREWGDDDECGVCKLCGMECTWHWEEHEGHKERVEDNWESSDNELGIIEKYVIGLQEGDTWQNCSTSSVKQ